MFTPGLAGLVLGEYRRIADEPARAARSPTARPTCCGWWRRAITAKQIGERLVLSHRTVENHVQNTLRKLQLHNRSQLVALRDREGDLRAESATLVTAHSSSALGIAGWAPGRETASAPAAQA